MEVTFCANNTIYLRSKFSSQNMGSKVKLFGCHIQFEVL